MSSVFDNRQCTLGEGPLWHPEREQLFWFDILGKKLLSRKDGRELTWQFDECVSAAGWISHDELIIASETKLFRFNVETQEQTKLCDLEADNSVTRSNDGRADPKGGFWIGTMGFEAEPKAGSIYRYFKGELRRIFPDITISNAICFAPDGNTAYFADTPEKTIKRVSLDTDGWPDSDPEVFIDLNKESLNPDGAVIDQEGNLWNAQWGANRVARYAPDGTFLDAISFDGTQISCPAFGGPDLKTLFATSAAINLDGEAEGKTFSALTPVQGQKEHQVIL